MTDKPTKAEMLEWLDYALDYSDKWLEGDTTPTTIGEMVKDGPSEFVPPPQTKPDGATMYKAIRDLISKYGPGGETTAPPGETLKATPGGPRTPSADTSPGPSLDDLTGEEAEAIAANHYGADPDPFAGQRREQREYCEKHAAPEGHRIVGYIKHSPMETAQLGEEYSPVVELIPAPLPAEVEEALERLEAFIYTPRCKAALATIRAALAKEPK